jgi:hypothetical protein
VTCIISSRIATSSRSSCSMESMPRTFWDEGVSNTSI